MSTSRFISKISGIAKWTALTLLKRGKAVHHRAFHLVLALIFMFSLFAPASASAGASIHPRASVDPQVLDQFKNRSETTFWLVMREKADLEAAYSMNNWEARGQFVYQRLQMVSRHSQAKVRSTLKTKGKKYQPFWIVNAIRVTADKATMLELSATDALTLLWPSAEQLASAPPGPDDVFVIATDTREYRACATCEAEPTLRVNDLARSINAVYGVPATNISTTTFSELKAFVLAQPGASDLTPDFQRANWVVLAMQTLGPSYPAADAAQLLLNLRPDLLENKRLTGFMFGAPQGLTTDELKRFTALYGLYEKLLPNIDVAVQALAGESVPTGRAPISLAALSYDLTIQTETDPAQVIQLMVGDEALPGQPTLPAPVPLLVGDTARIRTGVFIDRNGNPVPDGTPVQFIIQEDTAAAPAFQNAVTVNGVARTEYVLDKVGRLLIRATSEPALNSVIVQITMDEGGAVVATLAPTPIPTFRLKYKDKDLTTLGVRVGLVGNQAAAKVIQDRVADNLLKK